MNPGCVCHRRKTKMEIDSHYRQSDTEQAVKAHIECLEHNHDRSKNCNFGIFDKMDVVQQNLAGAQSCYVQSTS